MPDAPTTAYEEIPYQSRPIPQTHPDRLAVLATLFGMTPAPVGGCRVLELGCGDGGNLIPTAFGLPGSQFVGVEHSAAAVRRGQARVEELGLKNISLRVLDIREVPRELGHFDYVVANGVYSWVVPEVREKVLVVCRDHLNPAGVAFVGYNAYPGCRLREMAWDMIRYRVRQTADPRQRIAEAREFARFLADGAARPDAANQALVKEMKEVAEREDFLLFHDDLAEVNQPVYFHEFVEHAGRFGLQYLAEAEFFQMQDHQYPPRVHEPLRRLAGGDVVAREQYLDFLKCRRYRQTLLCREGVPLERPPRAERIQGFRVASDTRPVRGQANLVATASEQYQNPRGATMTTAYPPVKAALLALNEVLPRSLPLPELAARVQALLGQANVATASTAEIEVPFLAEVVLNLYSAGFVELHAEEPHFTTTVSERPVASPLVRLQIRDGERVLTNLRHTGITIRDLLSRQLVLLLDGTHDRAALLSELAAFAVARAVPLPPAGQPGSDPSQVRALLTPTLEPSLGEIARLALLVG